MSEPRTVFPVGPKDAGKRLDRFLQERIPGVSRSRIQQAIRERVSLSWGDEPRPSRPVMPGGEVRIEPKPSDEIVRDVPIPVLRRGDGWLAVDKPSGLPVHPVNKVKENSLIRMLRRQEGVEELRLVHRLDRETTGVLLIAATPEVSRKLAGAFERHAVAKEYLAVVRGRVAEDRGEIELAIEDDPDSPIRDKRRAGAGQQARTGWQVEGRGVNHTLLRLYPRQGRRHQLRVHLDAMGHPILGDILYGRDPQGFLDMVEGRGDPREREPGPVRHLLHCARLVLPDPAVPGRALEILAELPQDFQPYLE
ncbi:hypothetical protein ABI59_07255 [Acidobacteria bacterium Mor1]|nr:hypothetical protein ABI59_07255 [Acidobacteria bacterium Mor1]